MNFKDINVCLKNIDTAKMGERIEELINYYGTTRKELASKLGVGKSMVSLWCNGTVPTTENLFKLAQLFDCSMDYILTGHRYAHLHTTELTNGIDPDVQKIYSWIKNRNESGISFTDALNFLITDEIDFKTFKAGDPYIDLEFIRRWAAYLSLDMQENNYPTTLYNEDRNVLYSVPYHVLEDLELVRIIEILREKKQRFRETNKYKNLHKKNLHLEKTVLQCLDNNKDLATPIAGGTL